MKRIAFAVASFLCVLIASPAIAQTVITQAKALAGGVTPGDTAGYPVTLSQPGAYVLGSNLTVTPGTYGLYIGAANVDIDMNGFTLSSGGGGTYGVIGNAAGGTIRGGSIKTFRYSGIYLRGDGWTIDDMRIVGHGRYAVDATGARFLTVSRSLVADNGNGGIFSGESSVFMNNTIARSVFGVQCGRSCHVAGNLVDANFQGIALEGGMVLGNTITRNSGFGVSDLSSTSGIGNNTFIGNNPNGGHQVVGDASLMPNVCKPTPC